MGLAAGQARLLSITARLSDNEHSSQSLAYAKQRLADSAGQITNEYNEALDATKLTVLTGFNGSVPNYTDISYGLMTGLNTVACGKQYVVTDNKGRILVSNDIAEKFKMSGGDINYFIENVEVNGKSGHSQVDILINNTNHDSAEVIQKRKEAWEKYFISVGQTPAEDLYGSNVKIYATDKDYVYGEDENGVPQTSIHPVPILAIEKGNNTSDRIIINYDGTTQEQRELYDYAMALTHAATDYQNYPQDCPNTIAADPANADAVNYLKNIFYQMQAFGYVTSEEAFHLTEADSLHDNKWFEEQLKQGKLFLKSYSASEKTFMPTTLSDDSAIQEVEDERKIAMAEAKYTQDMEQLERQDQKFDLELKKLDTEHNALQTEYDALKSVVDKNIEKAFNAFS